MVLLKIELVLVTCEIRFDHYENRIGPCEIRFDHNENRIDQMANIIGKIEFIIIKLEGIGYISSLYFSVVIYYVSPSSRDYASPTSGEAYRDRRLTTNFEL